MKPLACRQRNQESHCFISYTLLGGLNILIGPNCMSLRPSLSPTHRRPPPTGTATQTRISKSTGPVDAASWLRQGVGSPLPALDACRLSWFRHAMSKIQGLIGSVCLLPIPPTASTCSWAGLRETLRDDVIARGEREKEEGKAASSSL